MKRRFKMKNKILSGGMVVVFTIMTVANLLATRINIAAQPAYDCHASECDPPCHDSECDYLAKIECNDFCALYNDYCLEVSLFETWCHYDTGEC